MAGLTSPWLIPTFSSTDVITAGLEGLLNAQSTALNTGLTTLQKATASVVANSAGQTALFPSPVQGNTVWRTDLQRLYTYYALYNSSTNPSGANPAGWYSGDQIGFGSVQSLSSAIPATATTIPGLSCLVEADGQPVELVVEVTWANGNSGTDRNAILNLLDGGTILNSPRNFVLPLLSGLTAEITSRVRWVYTPSAGLHTITAQTTASLAGAVVLHEANIVAHNVIPRS